VRGHRHERPPAILPRAQIKRFAQLHGVHVWLVAHPKQLQQWKGDAPGLYDISGSAHFNNKADVGLVVHRNFNAALGAKDARSRSDEGPAAEHADNPLAAQVRGVRRRRGLTSVRPAVGG